MSGPWEDYSGGTATATTVPPWEDFAAAKATPSRGSAVYAYFPPDAGSGGRRKSTTEGGPQVRTAGAPGAGATLAGQLGEAATAPAIPLPKFTVNKGDSRPLAAGKAAANLIIGLPEFAETPVGLATLPLGAVIPRTVAGIFSAQTLHAAGKQILDTYPHWEELSPAQQMEAMVQVGGGTGLGLFLAHSAVKGAGPEPVQTAGRTGADLTMPAGATPPPAPVVPPATMRPPAPVVTPRPVGAMPGSVASLKALGYEEAEINRLSLGERVRLAKAGTRKASSPAPAPVVLPSAAELQAAITGNQLQPVVKAGAELTPGENHEAAEANARAAGVSGPVQDGFATPAGEFLTREQAAAATGKPTTVEPGKLHSEDLALPSVPKQAGTKRTFLVPARSDGIHDILDEVQIHGGLTTPGADAGGEYDAYQQAMKGTAALLRRRTGGLPPDKMVANVQANFPRIQTPDDLYDAIHQARDERERLRATGGGAEAQTQRFWDTVSQGEDSGLEKLKVDDLVVGQTFRVKAPGLAHDELTVAHIDPDTGEVTVKDGPTFGRQDLPAGAEIYVRKGTLSQAAETEPGPWEDFGAAPPATPPEPGPWEDFKLAPPETVEQAKAREAAEAAAKAKAGQAEAVAAGAAKPLVGSTGDIGQGDLLGGGDLFAAPVPKPAAMPEFKATLFQGRGATPEEIYGPEAVQEGRAVPILGPGNYFTPSAEDAAIYGKVSQHAVELQKPFTIDSDRAWRELLDAAGATVLDSRGRDWYERPQDIAPATKRLQAYLKSKGYDGVIVKVPAGDMNAAGESIKGIAESFGHDQVVKFTGAPRVEGMGSTPRAVVAARATSQAAAGKAAGLPPGGGVLAGPTTAVLQAPPSRPWFFNLRAAVNPMSLGAAAKQTATVLRFMLGQRYRQEMAFDTLMAKYRRVFDTQTTPRNFAYQPGRPLPPNWELQWAVDTGDTQNLTPLELEFARSARQLLNAAVRRVQGIKPDVLTKLHQFYFPRYWRAEDEAAAARLAAIHRPFEGTKGFLKARTLQLWTDALEQGLRPRYDNPTDALRAKLGEMEMFASALEAHAAEKAAGRRRFLYIFERMPENWTKYDDTSTDVFAPPTVTIEEAYDEQIRTKTLEMFQKLGIDQRRLVNMGHGRWGEAQSFPEQVRTKFGGADFVFWHEFGHIMDFRYPDLRPHLGLTGKGTGRDTMSQELRTLADLRQADPKYARKAEEKMANVFDAYIRAPELFRQTAPNVWAGLQTWLAKHPDVAGPLNAIRPSLELGSGTAEKFVGGPILLGHWIVPVESAAVLNNYLQPGLWSKAPSLAAIKGLGGLISNVRLISAFHGQMVSNDALASGLSLPLYDALKGLAEQKPELLKRGLGALPFIPFRPITALVQGGRMLRSIREPGAAVPALDRQLADLAIEVNLRAGHGAGVEDATRRWKQALYETANSWRAGEANAPAVLEVLGRTPLMIAHQMMRPIMEWFVPRMKLGLAAPMLQRVVQDNPGMDPWELRQKLGKVGDAVEDRVGQVTYDNLFQSRMVKDSGQLALQAYGWHLTKERMLYGAASDYFKAGRAMLKGERPEITFRMTYLPALVVTHAIIGGSIMYMLTGRRPQTVQDYLFPETGLVDQYGKPVRLALADFLKDYMSEYRAAMHGPKAVAEEWERRLMPVWNELADMWSNKDFYNTKIFSERDFDEPEWSHVWKNLGEGVRYLGDNSQPFSAKGAQIFGRALPKHPTATQEMLAEFGPYFGFVPAPQSLTQSPAEARAAEIMRESLPPMSKDQAAHVKAISQLVQELRTGKIHGVDELKAAVREAGVKDNAELTRVAERVNWTPLQYQIHKLPLYQPGTGRDAMSVFDLMNDGERVQTAQMILDKIQRAYEARRLDVDTTSRLVRLVLPYAKQAAAQQQTAVQTRGRLRSMGE